MQELAPNSVLPAQREPITLHTDDGLKLVGELALPVSGTPDATFILCHPNPTGGEGVYDEGRAEGYDLKAAIDFAVARGLPNIWLMGWSFGTDVVLMHGNVDPVKGAILFSPPLKWSGPEHLAEWAKSKRPLTALVPELDDYLQPPEAKERFAQVPQCEVVAIPECKHLWVGEKFVRIAWNQVLKRVFPNRQELGWLWDGPMNKWDDLQGKFV